MYTLRPSRHYTEPVFIALLCFCTFFIYNDVFQPDQRESVCMVMAREMVANHDWLHPTLNGELCLYRSPLPPWITSLALLSGHDTLSMQRGMAALAATLLVFYFYVFAHRFLRMNAYLATLVFASSYHVVLAGRTISWEIFGYAFMMAAIFHLLRGLKAPPHKKRVLYKHYGLTGLWLGLSWLSNGSVPFYSLLLPFLLAWWAVMPRTWSVRRWPLCFLLIVALVVGGWWYAYHYWACSAVNPFREMVAATIHGPFRHRPFIYYWNFFLETGIWCVFLLTSLFAPAVSGIRQWRRCRAARPCQPAGLNAFLEIFDKAYRLPVVWMLLILLLLSLMPDKTHRHLFPTLIPAAYIMGYQLQHWVEVFNRKDSRHMPERILYLINSCLLTFVPAAIPFVVGWLLWRPHHIGWTTMAMVTFVCWGLVGFMVWNIRRWQVRRVVYAVAILFLSSECFGMSVVNDLLMNTARRSVATLNEQPGLAALPCYHSRTDALRMELVYNIGRPIRPIDTGSADSLVAHAPCLLMLSRPIDEYMPPAELKALRLTPYGRFDDNRRPKGHSRYNPFLLPYIYKIDRQP